MAGFFIDRPVFAWVIAIVIMLAGVAAIRGLPIAQYPAIAPPAVAITAIYPGASAKTLENSVTQVIEQQMKGIDNLRYMTSTSDASGQAITTLTFDAGTNPDIAQVQVQNKLQLATPLLPEEVQRQGITVTKSTMNFLVVLGFVSEDGSMSQTDLSDYVAANIMDPISRVDGVGDCTLFGSQYAMRVWLDPQKLLDYKLVPSDVAAAITAQNADISAGQLGAQPTTPNQRINFTVSLQERLQTPEQFGAIQLKVNPDGSAVYLRDVARMELGSEDYSVTARFNGKPATGLAIKLATGSNALDTANAINALMDKMSKNFPPGFKVVTAFDTTPFVRVSIREVIKTLVEAIGLVFLVMYLFLQNFRATLIPTIAVPVVLLGTFAVLAAFGFSINTLTMFGLVLAIGLLVDDAIVVVENVERLMSEEGLSPKEAARKSMKQISGALVGIALVLSAVFVPMAFFSGSTGVIYRQFSITIVSAMLLSVAVAMILTPTLCASMLKPVTKGHIMQHRGFFGWFNRMFDKNSARYHGLVAKAVRHGPRVFAVYGGIVLLMGFLLWRLPTAFLPDEDQGMLFVQVQMPVGSPKESTRAVLRQVEQHFLKDEAKSVESLMTVVGFSFAGNGQNMGMGFVRLKDWDQRPSADLRVPAIVRRAMGLFMGIRSGMVFAFAPPAVFELGNATGFDFELQDQGGVGHDKLMAARNQLLGMAGQNKNLVRVRPNGLEDTPQFQIDVDKAKAGAFGLSVAEINDLLSSAWGSAYINNFLDKGRVKKVYIQSDAPYRMMPEDLNRWYARNAGGDMVPMSAFAKAHWTFGAQRLERYNGQPSLEIQGEPAPGKSSGVAMAEMESMASQLPEGIGYSWTGLSYQERLAGSQTLMLYGVSIIIVFLCLAALYESWTIPFSVILVVPLGVAGAVAAATFRGLANDVYFQVGLLATIGLSAKNAILIVEFAKAQYAQGKDLVESVLEAARLRLRPILMTSMAFLLGVAPLAVSNGAGSGSQNDIGTGIMGGTFAATALGIVFVPVFFVMVTRLFRGRRPSGEAGPSGR